MTEAESNHHRSSRTGAVKEGSDPRNTVRTRPERRCNLHIIYTSPYLMFPGLWRRLRMQNRHSGALGISTRQNWGPLAEYFWRILFVSKPGSSRLLDQQYACESMKDDGQSAKEL